MRARLGDSSAQLLAKLLRSTGLAPRLNLSVEMYTSSGRFRVPLLRGATEQLLSIPSGFKHDQLQRGFISMASTVVMWLMWG